MQLRDLDDLVDEVKAGRLSAAEIRDVATALVHASRTDDQYSMLYIVYRSWDKDQYEGLVASFLDYGDAMLARLAIMALSEWGLGPRYRDEFLRFVRGVDWDMEQGGDARQMAMFRVGELVWDTGDSELARELLRLSENPAEDSLDRRDAVRGLYRALTGKTDAPLRFDPDDPWALDVRRQARKRFGWAGAVA